MIAILFARHDSTYKTLAAERPDLELDVYDAERDATRWEGGCPGVHHPPCRAWGVLRHRATRTRVGERALAVWSVMMVRRYGGVLEHPSRSTLWAACGLPRPGEPADMHGGYSISVLQWWWGHKCAKATWLYIVGCPPSQLPDMPLRLGDAEFVISHDNRRNRKDRHLGRIKRGEPGFLPACTKAEREHTPPASPPGS
jgi:hypothetical protein